MTSAKGMFMFLVQTVLRWMCVCAGLGLKLDLTFPPVLDRPPSWDWVKVDTLSKLSRCIHRGLNEREEHTVKNNFLNPGLRSTESQIY